MSRATVRVAREALDRRRGLLLVAVGGLLALAVQVAAPVGVPLYDGVVVQEPYRYLRPVGSQVGSPTSFESQPAVTGSESPAFAAATTENPSQAQLIARRDAVEITAGITNLRVSITPVEPAAAPAEGFIAGNVYRFTVTDSNGLNVRIKPCQGCISLVLRAPEGTADATLMRLEGGAWVAVETIHAGIVASYQTNPTVLGDYAVVARSAGSIGGLDPVVLVVGAVVVLTFAVIGLVLFRSRGGPGAGPAVATRRSSSGVGPPPPRPRAVPTKRRAPRRPPSGRSDQ